MPSSLLRWVFLLSEHTAYSLRIRQPHFYLQCLLKHRVAILQCIQFEAFLRWACSVEHLGLHQRLDETIRFESFSVVEAVEIAADLNCDLQLALWRLLKSPQIRIWRTIAVVTEKLLLDKLTEI